MNWIDLLRWIALVGGAIVLGLHFAVYKNAPRITYHPTAWRIFIAGNSLFTLYALTQLVTEKDEGTVYIITAAMIITLIGIILLEHTYHIRMKEATNVRSRTSRSRSTYHR